MAEHPEYVRDDGALAWLKDSEKRPEHNEKANGYSTCHFWSNFEIADMEFWRGRAYEDYFEHLDRAGGFFYERWGDAPVHSIALGLFEDASRIHWFVFASFFFSSLFAPWELRMGLICVGTGSVILDTSIFLTSIALIRPSARTVLRACSRTGRPGCIRRIVDRCGSSILAWAEGRKRGGGVVFMCL